MRSLRPWQESDAGPVVSWTGEDERTFRLWCADRFPHWPISAEDLIAHYREAGKRGDFFPMTMTENGVPAGSLILRYTDKERTKLRFGFVIADSAHRGEGLGHDLIRLALRHAFSQPGVEEVSLGVFEENTPAYCCYTSAGFHAAPSLPDSAYEVMGEVWPCRELLLMREEYEAGEKRP